MTLASDFSALVPYIFGFCFFLLAVPFLTAGYVSRKAKKRPDRWLAVFSIGCLTFPFVVLWFLGLAEFWVLFVSKPTIPVTLSLVALLLWTLANCWAAFRSPAGPDTHQRELP